MPNRDLKDSNRRSASLQLLSDAAERLWYRIITAVDDFGRMEADPEVVFNSCFIRQPKGWTLPKVEKCLEELCTLAQDGDVPMLIRYQIGHRHFLQIRSADMHIYKRAKVSKYPDPTEAQLNQHVTRILPQVPASAPQVRASAGGFPRTPNSESRTPNSESRTTNSELRTTPNSELRTPEAAVSLFEEFWTAYPERGGKKVGRGEAHALFRGLSTDDQGLAVQAVRHYAQSLRKQGISAKDPNRFLRNGKQAEPWRDWIDPPISPPLTGQVSTDKPRYRPTAVVL